ncbi:hypothetical protein SAMN05444161_6946 [Rhizobiales bacterium GAS191]|nr:hypothetical protein SAMN05444161_6946 [Rhizobiales bacterium GAS191]
MRIEIPKLVKSRGPVRIEKLSIGYQVWNDYRFIAFFFDLTEAEACMNCMAQSPTSVRERLKTRFVVMDQVTPEVLAVDQRHADSGARRGRTTRREATS